VSVVWHAGRFSKHVTILNLLFGVMEMLLSLLLLFLLSLNLRNLWRRCSSLCLYH